MLLDDLKTALRVTSDAFDAEISTLSGAALYDMERVGVNPALLQVDDSGDLSNPLVTTAVYAYCKAHFGYDNAEAGRLDDSYRRIVCDLLNSKENIAAIERSEHEDGSSDEDGEGGEGGSESGGENDGGPAGGSTDGEGTSEGGE